MCKIFHIAFLCVSCYYKRTSLASRKACVYVSSLPAAGKKRGRCIHINSLRAMTTRMKFSALRHALVPHRAVASRDVTQSPGRAETVQMTNLGGWISRQRGFPSGSTIRRKGDRARLPKITASLLIAAPSRRLHPHLCGEGSDQTTKNWSWRHSSHVMPPSCSAEQPSAQLRRTCSQRPLGLRRGVLCF